MLKKGRQREAKGLAVLYFIIGLIILLIILAVIYFALVKLDYSDRIDPETTVRPYVEQEETEPLVENADLGVTEENPVVEALVDAVDLTAEPEEVTVAENVEQPVAEVPEEPLPAEDTPQEEQAIEAPIEEAPIEEAPIEEAPVEEAPIAEEPAAEPAPEATPLPADKVAKPMTEIPKLPDVASENGKIGITNCYVSQADDNKLMYVSGYGYINVAEFDGAKAKSWLVVTQVASGQKIAYPLSLMPGISNLPHADAACQNASASDFELYVDVSQYQEGIYSLALVIGYVPEGKKDATFMYYPFSGEVSFTVLDGRVVTPITAVDYE